MTVIPPAKLVKNKKRRILVISAGGMQGGIQGMYISTNNGSYEILSHAFLPYPQKVADLIEKCSFDKTGISVSDLSWLEYKVSILFIDCAKTVLATLPKTLKQPHCIVLNKLTIWRGPTGENLQQSHWDLTLGDAQILASTFDSPVVTDFQRYNILAGGIGNIPVFPGNLFIAPQYTNVIALVNIGIVSRLTIIDKSAQNTLLDSDTGPGMSLINSLAKEAGCPDGFDRDGIYSAQGKVNSECLDMLASSPWFQTPGPKSVFPSIFEELTHNEQLLSLQPYDRLATITALTARTIYEFYRREYKGGAEPEVVILSGGGAKNRTLIEYLKTFFDPHPVKRVDEFGIPADMRVPFALGLTINAFLNKDQIPWESGNSPRVKPLGLWVMP